MIIIIFYGVIPLLTIFNYCFKLNLPDLIYQKPQEPCIALHRHKADLTNRATLLLKNFTNLYRNPFYFTHRN